MKPVLLMILDGFGVYKAYSGNAISLAKTPVLDELYRNYPNTTLFASEKWVGLPMGQMGNSEVGHLNIGAGRVVYQDLTRISNEIEDGSFFSNEKFLAAVNNCKKNNSAMHLMGLVSKGGVHSHFDHLLALVNLCKKEGLEQVYIHVITDGRDVSPNAAVNDVEELCAYLGKIGIGKIADISGRYYAMDRDKRWERTKKYFDLLTSKCENKNDNPIEAIKKSYRDGITDEFILPIEIDPEGKIKDNDSLIFFNFRPDRARQIVRSLVDENFTGFDRKEKNIYLVTMTQYDKTIPHTNVAFPENRPTDTLGEILEKEKMRQLRIAETEKYAHVTFFFNGGREEPFIGEDRILVPSPKVATYDMQPEMSAPEITKNLIEKLRENIYDCIILNFANPDMVGHTGVIPAAVKAVETVDNCIGKILEEIKKLGGVALITADHGNCDMMLTEDNKPITSHTTNLVPFIVYGMGNVKLRSGGALCDISPTILQILKIKKPDEMTGKSLIENN